MPVTRLLLAVAAAPDALCAPHHGGKTANTPRLYSWARPRTLVVSQHPLASGATDVLAPMERAGIPLLRTSQCGAVRLRWQVDRIITRGFLDRTDGP